MAQRLGLRELYAPPKETTVTAYIIFVHGLFGHPQKTWTAKRSEGASNTIYWPKDLLPTVIPDAKIYTFGYDADVDNFFSTAGQNTIHQHTRTLLEDLADLLAEQEKPLIFVAHSLGGIIVKDALNQSAATVGTRLNSIAPATIGVCFLGTPHRGSQSASLGKLAYACAVFLTKRPNLMLLKALEKNSEILDRIGSSFSQTILKYNTAIYSFHEEKEVRNLLIFSTIVVNADSAKIGDGREGIGTIPASHRDMTKFGSANDIGFKRVSAQLQRWVKDIRVKNVPLLQDGEDCLASLIDEDTEIRIREVRGANENTFHWLFNPGVVSFSDWLTNQNAGISSMYWIQGKPGSGKSTLMKFAMNNQSLWKILTLDGQKEWIISAYFFHDRGSGIQKSLTGMLHQILGSILKQAPALISFVIPFYHRLVRAQRSKKPAWKLDDLESAMLAIAKQRKTRLQLLMFLDALDEHDGDNDTLALLLRKITEATDGDCVHIKCCLASRPWNVFKDHFGKCSGFAIHAHTSQDIRMYIENRLNLKQEELEDSSVRKDVMRIVDLVATKAQGVFIWVRLVMDLLSKGIRDGTPYAILEEQISEMPPELKDLYAATLRRVEPRYSEEAYIMLQITLKSLEPLTLGKFMIVADLNTPPFIENLKVPDFLDERYIALYKSRLESRSGGLLELSRPASRYSGPADITVQPVVQFIHQTVKEFIQSPQELGLIRLSPKLMNRDGNFFILRSFIRQSRALSRSKKDIFIYAVRASVSSSPNGIESADLSKVKEVASLVSDALLPEGPNDLEWFLRQQSGKIFFGLQDLIKQGQRRVALVKLAVVAGLPELIDIFENFELRGLLHVVILSPVHDLDHEKVIRYLIARGCPVDGLDEWSLYQVPTSAHFNHYGFTALTLALLIENIDESTRMRISSVLLESGADPLTLIIHRRQGTFDAGTIHLVEFSIMRHSAALVRMLLQHIRTPSSQLNNGYPKYLALLRGDHEIMQVLQDFGVWEDTPSWCSVSERLLLSSLCLAVPAGRPVSSQLSGHGLHKEEKSHKRDDESETRNGTASGELVSRSHGE